MRVAGFLVTVFVGLLLGWSAHAGEWRSPQSVEGAITTSVDEAEALYAQKIPFVDVRSQRQFDRRHIAGAHHLDLKNGFTAEALAQVADREEPLVIYCNGAMCSRSYHACEQAVEWGFTKVHYFRGGITDWRRAGLPVATNDR